MLQVLLLRGLRKPLHSLRSTALQRVWRESGQKVRSGRRLEVLRAARLGKSSVAVPAGTTRDGSAAGGRAGGLGPIYSGCGACHWQAQLLGLGQAWRKLGQSLHLVRILTVSRFTFDQPYEFASLPPQEIREDFSDLCFGQGMDPQSVLDKLASYLPADELAQFLDDLAMGRV